jgi:hypothetical protein
MKADNSMFLASQERRHERNTDSAYRRDMWIEDRINAMIDAGVSEHEAREMAEIDFGDRVWHENMSHEHAVSLIGEIVKAIERRRDHG